jgi:hypothetical protein
MRANSGFEINDLIDDAVNNAVARRNEVLPSLSDEETQKVAGGAQTVVLGIVINPLTVILGIII